jgi:hypothetical protein
LKLHFRSVRSCRRVRTVVETDANLLGFSVMCMGRSRRDLVAMLAEGDFRHVDSLIMKTNVERVVFGCKGMDAQRGWNGVIATI